MSQSSINAEVTANLDDVRIAIAQAEADGGRSKGAVTLIGVSKQQPDERVDAALTAGLRIFGENRVQEADSRWTPRRSRYPEMELHLIGPLQTNKAKDAVRIFDVIQTVDRPRIATALARAMADADRALPCFVQVNTGEERQKAGVAPANTAAFVKECQDTHGLNILGLMCIPPAEDAPAPHFAFLKDMADKLGLAEVSMGMSADFPAAAELGATHIRVGSAIFGQRPKT
jgi:hypothetical protein